MIEPLGTGGMSVVWRAFDEVLGRPVAVKLLAPTLLTDARSRGRIQSEARAAALLSHPHIAQVYDFGHGPDGSPYVVMELVTGRSLEHAGPLTTGEVLRLGAQLASALAAVHARGLVHRDVKPANVMLTDGGAKLVDFGISAVAGDHSDLSDEILGTPAYVAPERLCGLPTTAATDVYALGMLLYRALTQRFPWPPDVSTANVLDAHCRIRPEPLPPGLVDEPVARALARCLAKAPENRPSAAEMCQVLSDAVRQETAPIAKTARRTAAVPRASLERTAVAPGAGALGRLAASGAVTRGRLAAAGVVAAAAVGALATCSNADGSGAPAWMAAAATPAAPSVDCTVQYSVRSESDTAFTADLQLTAASQPTGSVGGWNLTFRVPEGQSIDTVDGATWQQGGQTVLLRGAALDRELAGGAHFTISGAPHGGSDALPTDFALNGSACRSVLLAPAAVQSPPAATTAANTGTGSTGDHTNGNPEPHKAKPPKKDENKPGSGKD